MTLIEYKKAYLKYAPQETFAAGIGLFGPVVQWLLGMTNPPYQVKNTPKEDGPERSRRLLLKKQEIAQLGDAESKKGLTIVPLEVYNSRGLIKVKVAIVRGKGKADKREDLKRKDAKIEQERALKSR